MIVCLWPAAALVWPQSGSESILCRCTLVPGRRRLNDLASGSVQLAHGRAHPRPVPRFLVLVDPVPAAPACPFSPLAEDWPSRPAFGLCLNPRFWRWSAAAAWLAFLQEPV